VIAGCGRGIDVMRRRGRGQRVGAHSRERRGAARRKKSVLGRGGAWRNAGARRKKPVLGRGGAWRNAGQASERCFDVRLNYAP
jgi:hypothetical protein